MKLVNEASCPIWRLSYIIGPHCQLCLFGIRDIGTGSFSSQVEPGPDAQDAHGERHLRALQEVFELAQAEEGDWGGGFPHLETKTDKMIRVNKNKRCFWRRKKRGPFNSFPLAFTGRAMTMLLLLLLPLLCCCWWWLLFLLFLLMLFVFPTRQEGVVRFYVGIRVCAASTPRPHQLASGSRRVPRQSCSPVDPAEYPARAARQWIPPSIPPERVASGAARQWIPP